MLMARFVLLGACFWVPRFIFSTASQLGNTKCPCVDPWANAGTIPTGPGVDAANADCALTRIYNSSTVCYDKFYGSQKCRVYDVGVSPECLEKGRPDWCDSKWCFIDPDNCERPSMWSMFFPSVWSGGKRLTFSYATCGNLNTYSNSERVRELQQAGPIRVAFPGDSGSGFTIVTTTDGGVQNTNRGGSVVKFVTDILNEYQTEWYEVPVSKASQEYSGSSYTNCVHEVALNNTDICIGNFWPIPSRRVLTTFSSPIYIDYFQVVSFKSKPVSQTTLWSLLEQPFTPFDASMWIGILCTLLYVGIVMWLVEGTTNADDFPGASDREGILEGAWKSLQAFVGGSDIRFNPHTAAGRLTIFSMSLCVLVLTSQYTAQVTTNLVSKEEVAGKITSLLDGVSKRIKFCGLGASKDLLSKSFSGLEPLYVVKSNAQEVFWGMDDGECGAGIVTRDEWQKARRGGYSQAQDRTVYANHANGPETYHCDTKVLLDETLLTIDNALPVRGDLQASLSWALSDKVAIGGYESYAEEAKEEFLEPSNCEEEDEEEEDWDEMARTMSFEEGGGALLVAAVGSTLSLFMFCCKEIWRCFYLQRFTHNKKRFETPDLRTRAKQLWKYEEVESAEFDTHSTAYHNADMVMLKKMYETRHLTTKRCNLNTSHMKTNMGLWLADVPTIVKLIAEAAAKEVVACQAAAVAAGGVSESSEAAANGVVADQATAVAAGGVSESSEAAANGVVAGQSAAVAAGGVSESSEIQSDYPRQINILV